jgi:hypothetical protein
MPATWVGRTEPVFQQEREVQELRGLRQDGGEKELRLQSQAGCTAITETVSGSTGQGLCGDEWTGSLLTQAKVRQTRDTEKEWPALGQYEKVRL